MPATPGNRLREQLAETLDGHGAQINAFTGTHGNGSCLNLPVSNDQEIGNLEQSMLADFKADLLVSQVGFGPEALSVQFADDLLGKKDGKRFLPILTTIFFMVLFMNITGIIPFLNIAGTSIIAVPLTLAIVSYVTFIYAGIKKSPKNFFKNSLFPSGVPPFLYIIVTPLEFLSTFIIRPVTLTLRLLMNMIVGHLMLVLFFSATQFFIITLGSGWIALGAGTLAFGFAFTLFEVLVAFLQAYVFTILTAVYIQLAVAEEH